MNWFIDFFLSLFQKNPSPGVLPDNRTLEEKQNDIEHQEVYAGSSVQWVEKSSYKKYSQRDQTFTGSTCLAHSAAKAIEIEGGAISSARDIYDLRSNKNGGTISSAGMVPYNALQIVCNNGATTEVILPSNKLNDFQITQPFTRTGEIIATEAQTKGGYPVNLPIDIDTIASAVDAGRGVILCLNFTQKEWIDVPFLSSSYSGIHHGMAIEDRTIYKGQKAFVIGDSWLPETTINKQGQRIITEEFLLARCTFAGYRFKLPPPITSPKPQHIFTSDMYFGMTNNEVVQLQDRLKYEGVFPNIPSTGYFGTITKSAIISYQKAHNIPATGYCGPITRTSLNS